MPIAFDDLFEVLVELSKIKELRATASNSVKGGLITGAITAVGGLLLGKYGLLLGGLLGGVTSTALANDFKPVWIILRDLQYEKRKALCSKVMNAVKNIGIQEVAAIGTLLLSDVSLQSVAIREISRYLQDEYNLRVM